MLYSTLQQLCRYRLVLFLMVGSLNTLFNYTLFALLIALGVNYMLAMLVATCLGVLFNFQTTGKIVFKNRDNSLLMKFIGVYIITYFINIGLIKYLHFWIKSIYIAGAIAVLSVALITFYLQKTYVFTMQKKAP